MTPPPNRPEPNPADQPRLRMVPEARHAGPIAGAWWPHSNDLVTELHGFLPALTARLGPIHRVIYHLGTWAPAPRKARIGDRQVCLDGYRHRPATTLDVVALNGTAVAVLIIPPNTTSDSAHAAMAAAADPTNPSTIDSLLAITAPKDIDDSAETVGAEQQWESDGGAGGH
ncbi:hypothetical protein AWN90_02755 [Nocardia terpenica]|uniref:Uncharacterized protein n=2 Tax=Nocardia terpenica TaxID=455432 RepID=A0A164KXR8_9NOCA|nr:hypothetical protein AWN90_02755 [Nocardia terpenica]NQE90887.1 hypothetical protein [Nocardia terpenica]